MKLYLTRHAQTNYNLTGVLDSGLSKKVHLTKEGIKQTERLAKELKNTNFDVIYISELFRTKQTADIINQFHDVPVIIEPLINELRTGYENKQVGDWFAAIEAADDKWSVTFDDGESLNDASGRTQAFLDKVKQSGYTSVLVITHGFIVQVISALLHGQPHEKAFDYDVKQGTYEEFNLSI